MVSSLSVALFVLMGLLSQIEIIKSIQFVIILAKQISIRD
ncbi:hypothetical protein MHA_2617 [Mannheimia haemolytica PHL213]|nr:hypothetical protein MHH_c17670 [Mannheimia haemolytica M42548]EDN75487.1 hypothetical protein MHA_2617 [Mannheimia haemolytica PHL213]